MFGQRLVKATDQLHMAGPVVGLGSRQAAVAHQQGLLIFILRRSVVQAVVLDGKAALLTNGLNLDAGVFHIGDGSEKGAGHPVFKVDMGDGRVLHLDLLQRQIADLAVHRADGAAQKLKLVQGVDGLVDHTAPARLGHAGPPGSGVVVAHVPGPDGHALDAQKLSVLAGTDQLLQLHKSGV